MNRTTKTAITRREFATRAALAGAAATLGAAPALSQTATPVQAGTNSAPAVAAQNESELRVRTILSLYGDRFSESQKTDLLKISSGAQKSLDLKPLMEREKKTAAPAGDMNTHPTKP
jgi:hypothetical protein